VEEVMGAGNEDNMKEMNERRRINLIEKPTPVRLVKNTREPPGLVLKGLHIHDLNKEQVALFRSLDLEGPGKVVYLGEVYVADIISTVIVADLTAGPVG
jgi:hypothetical protein